MYSFCSLICSLHDGVHQSSKRHLGDTGYLSIESISRFLEVNLPERCLLTEIFGPPTLSAKPRIDRREISSRSLHGRVLTGS